MRRPYRHMKRRTRRFQKSFRMVSRRDQFTDSGFSLGEKPREKKGGFYLGARQGIFEINGLEFPSPDPKRRKIGIVFSFDLRPHLLQGPRHAVHGTGTERLVARKDGLKGLTRENAEKHPKAGAGISKIQFPGGGREPAKAFSFYFQHALFGIEGDRDSQGAKGLKGAETVVGLEKILKAAFSLGERAKHDGSVGNGFVPRRLIIAPEEASSLEFHGVIDDAPRSAGGPARPESGLPVL